MNRLMMVLIVLAGAALVGCAGSGTQKKERPHTGTYEKVSPFETGQDPFEVG